MKMGLAFIIHLLKWEKLFNENLCHVGWYSKRKKNQTFVFIVFGKEREGKKRNKKIEKMTKESKEERKNYYKTLYLSYQSSLGMCNYEIKHMPWVPQLSVSFIIHLSYVLTLEIAYLKCITVT